MNKYSYPTFKRPKLKDSPIELYDKVRFTPEGLAMVNEKDRERVSGIGVVTAMTGNSHFSTCTVEFDRPEIVPLRYLEKT